MLVIAYFIPISFLLQLRKPRLAHQCHYTRLIQRITNKNDAQMKCKQTNKTNERTNKQHKYTHTQPHSLTHSHTQRVVLVLKTEDGLSVVKQHTKQKKQKKKRKIEEGKQRKCTLLSKSVSRFHSFSPSESCVCLFQFLSTIFMQPHEHTDRKDVLL